MARGRRKRSMADEGNKHPKSQKTSGKDVREASSARGRANSRYNLRDRDQSRTTADQQAMKSRKAAGTASSGGLDANRNREAQPEVYKTSDSINSDSKSRINDDHRPMEPTSHDDSQQKATDDTEQSETINQSSGIFGIAGEYDFSQVAGTHAADEATPADFPLNNRVRVDRTSYYSEMDTTAATLKPDWRLDDGLDDKEVWAHLLARQSGRETSVDTTAAVGGSETSVDTTATVLNLDLYSLDMLRPRRSRSRRYHYRKKKSKIDRTPTALDGPPPPNHTVSSDYIAKLRAEREKNAKTQEEPDVKLPDTALRNFRLRTDATNASTRGG